MATDIQRAQSIADAFYNATATQQQLARVGVALAEQVGQKAAYLEADNAGKATIAVSSFRTIVVNAIKDSEARTASQAAADAAVAAVSAEFP